MSEAAKIKEKTPDEIAKENAFQRLTESQELCKRCRVPEESQGIHLGPNGPYGCEGQHCPEAFTLWMEEATNCEMCGKYDELDNMSELVSNADGSKLTVCEDCYMGAD